MSEINNTYSVGKLVLPTIHLKPEKIPNIKTDAARRLAKLINPVKRKLKHQP